MKKCILVLLAFIIADFSWAQISGPLSGSLGPGEFAVTGEISVQSGDSLRLFPGTTLNFMGPYGFLINGMLLAEGTAEDSIVFTTNPVLNPVRWRSINFQGESSSASRLSFCRIEHSEVLEPLGYGGGVFCYMSSPAFTHCVITDNHAIYGGGVYCYLSSPEFENCIVSGNTADVSGGGVRLSSSSPHLVNCIIRDNSSNYGGGIFCWDNSDVLVSHCTIVANTAANGGGVYIWNSAPTILGSIIVHSTGSGIHFRGGDESQVDFCGLFGNSLPVWFENGDPQEGPAAIAVPTTVNANGDAADTYMNIFKDPMFMDLSLGDFYLMDESRYIGASDSNSLTPLSDYNGEPRPMPVGSLPDIGAFEHPFGVPNEIKAEDLVISVSGMDVTLSWTFEGAAEFRVFSDMDADGLFETLAAVTSDTIITLEGEINNGRRFYRVEVVVEE